MSLVFYTNPMSRGRISRWMLEEVGAPYETVILGYADSMKAADYYRWLFFAAGPVEHAITNRSLEVTPTEQQQRMAGYGNYELAIDTFERAVAAHPYIAGDRFTAADVYVGAQVGWGLRFGTVPKRDAFVDYWQRLEAREAWRRASAKDDAAMPPAA